MLTIILLWRITSQNDSDCVSFHINTALDTYVKNGSVRIDGDTIFIFEPIDLSFPEYNCVQIDFSNTIIYYFQKVN